MTNNQNRLPEYTSAELEQNAIDNVRNIIANFEDMVAQGLRAENIVGLIHDASYRGYKTLRYPPKRTLEPWRINEIGIRDRHSV